MKKQWWKHCAIILGALCVSLALFLCFYKKKVLSLQEYWSGSAYFFLIDRFSDGNLDNNVNVDKENISAFQGGDFEGMIKNYSYFQKLGTHTLVTTPFLQGRRISFFGHWAFHGYWPIDHFQVDEHFGTLDDVARFTRTRLKSGEKFLLDIVLNHVGDEHPWFQEHKDWFHSFGSVTNWDDLRELELGDIHGLPDLDQSNENVYQGLLSYTKFWLDKTEAEGIRIDAAKHIAHDFWKRFIKDIKDYVKNPNFLILGEVLHGDMNFYDSFMDDGFNAFYDYPLYYTVAEVFAQGQSMSNLSYRLNDLDAKFDENILLGTFIDNHDMPRFLSLSESVTEEDLKQALVFYHTIRGMPVIYSGTESYTQATTGEGGRVMLDMNNVPLSSFLARLSQLRDKYKSLSLGKRQDVSLDFNEYAYRKTYQNEDILVILSRLGDNNTFILDTEKYNIVDPEQVIVDELKPDRKYSWDGKTLSIEMAAKDMAIIVLKK